MFESSDYMWEAIKKVYPKARVRVYGAWHYVISNEDCRRDDIAPCSNTVKGAIRNAYKVCKFV